MSPPCGQYTRNSLNTTNMNAINVVHFIYIMDSNDAVLGYVLSTLTGFAACFLAVGGCITCYRTTRRESQTLLNKSKCIELKTVKGPSRSKKEHCQEHKFLEHLTEVRIHGDNDIDDYVMFDIHDGDNDPNRPIFGQVTTSTCVGEDTQPISTSDTSTCLEECNGKPLLTGVEEIYKDTSDLQTLPIPTVYGKESASRQGLPTVDTETGNRVDQRTITNGALSSAHNDHNAQGKNRLIPQVPFSSENTTKHTSQPTELVKPCVKLYLCYSSVMSSLSVKLIGVSHLPAKNCGKFCKVKVRCLRTRNEASLYTKPVQIKGVQATFQESLTFKNISKNEFIKSNLRISAYILLPEEEDFFIGERYIRCATLPLTTGKSHYMEETLKEKRLLRRPSTTENGSRRDVGNVLVVLQYDSALGSLNVSVQKAQNLPTGDRFRKNPKYYTVISFLNESHVAALQKSSIQAGNSPVWNHTCTFSVDNGTIEDCFLEITINRFQKYQRDTTIGRVTLGAHSNKFGASHWSDMIQPRGLGIARWHEFPVS